MRVFSTFAATTRVIRKSGYYPTRRTSARLATQLAAVLELSELQRNVAERMLHSGVSEELVDYSRMTPAEVGSIRTFLEWYSMDTLGAFGQRAYVLSNLNTGATLVIHAAQSVILKDVIFTSKDRVRMEWVNATEDDIKEDIAQNARLTEMFAAVDSTLTLGDEGKTV